MAKILSTERVIEYSVEFKVKVVELTLQLECDITQIASILDLHPVMVYRWRQEYREGKFILKPTRKIHMTKPTPSSPKTKEKTSEVERLRKQVVNLKKENSFLKKWQRYLKDQKQHDSDL